MTKLQDKLEERHYTTTLAFAHDLCEVINVGINTESKSDPVDELDFETIDVSPTKNNTPYVEARDRKRLGKRILKSVQPQLETALKAEADISSKLFETLQKELEGMLDASLEVRQPTITVSQEDDAAGNNRDIDMVDAPEEAQIIVRDPDDERDAEGEVVDDLDADAAPDKARDEENIEVSTSELEESAKINGTVSSNVSIAGEGAGGKIPETQLTNGRKDSGSPPDLNGFGPGLHPPHPGPLTPPQSNGSLGRGQTDVLNEGGLPWYLKGFELQGTTVVEEQWNGRDAVRSLSEELTDMDEEALKDLEFDVDDETITASPHETPNASSSKKRANPAKFRKGVRSSARRR